MKSYFQSFKALLHHVPGNAKEAVFKPTEKYKILLNERNTLLQDEDYNDHYKAFGKDAAQVADIIYMVLKKKTKDKDGKEAFSFAVKALAKANGSDPDAFLEAIGETQNDFLNHRYDAQDIKRTKSLLKEVFKVANEFDKSEIEQFNKALQKFHLIRQSPGGKYVGKILSFNQSLQDMDMAADQLRHYPEIKKNDKTLKKVTQLAEAIGDYGIAVGTVNAYCVSNRITQEGVDQRVRELPRARYYFQKALANLANDPDLPKMPEAINILLELAAKEKKLFDRQLMPDITLAFAPQGFLDNELLKSYAPPENKNANFITRPERMIATPLSGKIQHEAGIPAGQAPADSARMETAPPAPADKPFSSPLLSGSDFRAKTSTAIGAEPYTDQFIQALNKYGDPREFSRMRDPNEANARPAAFDDKHLRSLQRINDWQDHADNLSRKVQKVEEIGNVLEDMASTPSGKPDPEYISLVKREKRLKLLQRMMQKVPEVNKVTNEVEKTALDAHHGYLQGLNTIMSGQLKNRIEEANIKSSMNLMAVRGAKNVASKMFETESEMKQFYEKMFNAQMQIEKDRDNNTWTRIKNTAGSFRY